MSNPKVQVATPTKDDTKSKRAKSDRSKTPKSKVKKGKGKKTEKEVPARRSRINLDQGIYINPSRCKFWMDTHGLNRDIEKAIEALRLAEPHDIKNKEGVVTKTTKLVPLSDLPHEVQQLVEQARIEWEDREKQRLEKEKKDVERAKNSAEAAEKLRLRSERQQKAAEERQAKIDAAVAAGDAPTQKKVTPYSREIELLSKMRIRFSKDSSLRTAATICAAIHELMTFGMENVIKLGRSIIKQSHILEPGYENLPLACLYTKLGVFKDALEQEKLKTLKIKEDKERKDREKQAAKAASKDDKEVKTEEVEKVEDDVDDVDDADEVVDDDVSSEDDVDTTDSGTEVATNDNGLDFKHYIRQVCFNIIAQKKEAGVPGYDIIRVSQEIKDFGSNLVIAFIQDLCPMLDGQIKIMNVRTISPDVVKHVINFHLLVANIDPKEVDKRITEKISKYATFAAERKAKNAEKKKSDQAAKKKATDEVDEVDAVDEKLADLKVDQPKASRARRSRGSKAT